MLEGLDTGEVTKLGDGTLPEPEAGPDRQVRARFLRWLVLGAEGSEHRVHEKGVRVQGALIVSDGPGRADARGLDLEGCTVERDIVLFACRLVDAPLLLTARLKNLFLDGSHLPGLNADRLSTTGGVFLRSAKTTGDVRLLGARIGGDLDCVGTEMVNEGGKALNADGARITGAFFLRALKGKHAKITGTLDLTGTEIGDINDHPDSWPEGKGSLLLDRCVYGAFTGHGVTARDRLRWLALQNPARYGKSFWPQPYEQCAKVLREMGHREDAKRILVEKERLQRADRRARMGWPRRWGQALWDGFLGAAVGYGQRPLRAGLWLAGLWLIGWSAFAGAWEARAFKPNHPVGLRSAEWAGCAVDAAPYAFRRETGTASQLGCYLAQPEAKGLPAFDPPVYALDVLFPLVDLEQQKHWVPDEDIWPSGLWAKWLVYAEIILGWFFSLLAVAGLSGLIRSD